MVAERKIVSFTENPNILPQINFKPPQAQIIQKPVLSSKH
jgi:hypothetical protein